MNTGFSIRTAIFSIVLAFALWTLVSLRGSYEVPISVPLEFICPQDRSIEAEVPRNVRLQIRSSGWHLVNLLYLSADAKCVIDLSNQKATVLTITTDEIQQSFRSAVPATVLEVFAKAFAVQLGVVGEKRVAIRADIPVETAQGFILTKDVAVQPDSVTVRANLKLLESIQEWPTMRLPFRSCMESQAGTIHMSDSLASIVHVEPSTVRYSFDIQRSAELNLEDIPVRISGAAASSTHTVKPGRVNVLVRGGVETIEKLKAEDISVFVDYATLSRDTTGVIVPTIRAASGLRVLSVQPAVLLHINETARPSVSERVKMSRRN